MDTKDYIKAKIAATQADLVMLQAILEALTAAPGVDSPVVVTPPVVTPPVVVIPTKPAGLTILTPDYNGKTGAITFKSEGGDGSRIEYQALGVTDWSDNPSRQVDKGLYLEAQRQEKSITIRARQSGKEASPLVFKLKSTGVDSPGGVVVDKPTTNPPDVIPTITSAVLYESLLTVTD